MSTLSDRAVKAGSPPAVPPEPESTAQAGAHARASVALPSLAAPAPVTERARAAGAALARAAEYLDKPGSLVHAQPPTLARAREQHHEAAARHGTPAIRYLRLLYGYLHLLFVKTVLNGFEWATENPARLLVAVIVGLIVWFWS